MSKCKPIYLVCHYEPDEGVNLVPMPITIDYKKIESDELNEKIADLIKDFEKKYIFKTESTAIYGKSARGE